MRAILSLPKTWIERIALVIALLILFLAVFGPWIAPYDPTQIDLRNRLAPPSATHWLGTDSAGRDVLSRLLAGAQVTILSTVTVIAAALAIGLAVGITSAFVGGTLDNLLMRFSDIWLSFPPLILALGFAADGIGLCRTEHMFFEKGRITPMRRMILADHEADRRAALEVLLPMQRADFVELFLQVVDDRLQSLQLFRALGTLSVGLDELASQLLQGAVDLVLGDADPSGKALAHQVAPHEAGAHEVAQGFLGHAFAAQRHEELVERQIGAAREFGHAVAQVLVAQADAGRLGGLKLQAFVDQLIARDLLQVALGAQHAQQRHPLGQFVFRHDLVVDRDGRREGPGHHRGHGGRRKGKGEAQAKAGQAAGQLVHVRRFSLALPPVLKPLRATVRL